MFFHFKKKTKMTKKNWKIFPFKKKKKILVIFQSKITFSFFSQITFVHNDEIFKKIQCTIFFFIRGSMQT